MSATRERAVYVNLCEHPAQMSAEATGDSTGVILQQAHGDTIAYRFYFRDGDTLVDPPAGLTYSLIGKRQGDRAGSAIISQNTDGAISTLTDTDGRQYLEVKLAPTAELTALFARSKSCPHTSPEEIRLDAELSWNNGGEIRRTKVFRILYTHGVVKAGEVFAELDPPSSGISAVTLAAGNELASGNGTALSPLDLRWDSERIELPLTSGVKTFDMSAADYSALAFTPVEYEPVAVVPAGSITTEFAIALGGVKGDIVRFTGAIPAAGWKLRVRAYRPTS